MVFEFPDLGRWPRLVCDRAFALKPAPEVPPILQRQRRIQYAFNISLGQRRGFDSQRILEG